ncbi:hypothetical protein [Emticicia sp. 17c]|uniref:hypothetical protein n=1 Tax=Emticicia sp. 17c TaxID=3127704 RepID=UPI00301E18C5
MSSFLKTKSDQNIQIAHSILSTNNGCYASSIHCSYYSCVQLMLHILRSHFGQTDSEVSAESESAKGGLHLWLIKKIAAEYEVSTNKYDARELKQKLHQLKKTRGTSDYENVEITQSTAQRALQQANNINSSLKRIFNL